MADETHAAVAESAETTKAAAQVAAGAAVKTKSAAERATELAADRTLFAAERTYAAWVRTGLVGRASGLGSKSSRPLCLPGLRWRSPPVRRRRDREPRLRARTLQGHKARARGLLLPVL